MATKPSKEDLKYVLEKHEERETPEQEAAESKREEKIEREAGVEKSAFWNSFEKQASLAKKLRRLARKHIPGKKTRDAQRIYEDAAKRRLTTQIRSGFYGSTPTQRKLTEKAKLKLQKLKEAA